MNRECGECQLCCNIIGVKELEKDSLQSCKHQCSTGCAIHLKKPAECKTYQCLWRSDLTIADDKRPDKLGCVINIHEGDLGTVLVLHQSQPNQWQNEELYQLIYELASSLKCWIYAICGLNHQAIFPKWAGYQQSVFDEKVKSDNILDLCGPIIHPDI